jgi:hypothetical protein
MNRRAPEEREEPVADVEIGAAARARKLRFHRVPDTEVEFDGDNENDSHTERENLPDQVEPEVTYRDVRVRWRAGARARLEDPDETLTDPDD